MQENPSPSKGIRDETDRHYRNILHDPRLIRLRNKWAPGWDGKGLKQRGKNYITLSHLPVVGVFFCWTDAVSASKNEVLLDKVVEGNTNQELEGTFELMQNNMKVQKVRQYTFAICKTVLFFASPAGTAGVSSGVASVAGTAASHGTVMVTKAIAKDSGEIQTADLDVNDKYGQTKALLLYLGTPPTNDEIYQTWEESRMFLKSLYGAKPEDDLSQMEPKGEVLKKIQQTESSGKPYNSEALGVSLLLLLWRVYDCWTEKIYDKLRGESYAKNRNKLFRARDERFILEALSPIDKNVYWLDKTYTKEALQLCMQAQPMAYGTPHSRYNFLTKKQNKWQTPKYQAKQRERLEWTFERFFEKTFHKREASDMHEEPLQDEDDDEKGAVWGYRSESTKQLKALICFIKPDQKLLSLESTYGTAGALKHLRSNRDDFNSVLEWEDKTLEKKTKLDPNDIESEEEKKKKNTRLHAGALLFYACEDSKEGKHGLRVLLRSLIEYTSVSSYVLEYASEKDRLEVLEKAGFKETETLKAIENNQVKVLVFHPPNFKKNKEVLGSRMEAKSRRENLDGTSWDDSDYSSNGESPKLLSPTSDEQVRGNSPRY